MENKKLDTSEIEKVKELQQRSANITAEFGNLEIVKLQMESRKNDLVAAYSALKQEEVVFGKELSEKYGDGTIDIEKGEFIAEK
jgi:stress response protein YsnF